MLPGLAEFKPLVPKVVNSIIKMKFLFLVRNDGKGQIQRSLGHLGSVFHFATDEKKHSRPGDQRRRLRV